VYGVKSFEHAFDSLEERCHSVLDLIPAFDERYIRSNNDWESTLYPALRTFLLGAAKDHPRLRLALDAHVTPKGEFGGDLIQRVVGPAGQICGSILWEAKRTKNWAEGWLGKVREDQRAAKADMALIVSHALPKGLQTFDQIDGVWVTARPGW
jgi:Uncharacterized protein conserved in bacteria (DUF2130)